MKDFFPMGIHTDPMEFDINLKACNTMNYRNLNIVRPLAPGQTPRALGSMAPGVVTICPEGAQGVKLLWAI